MFYILEKELKEKRMTREEFAKKMNLGITTISCKLNMKNDFTLSECQRAKRILGFEGTIDELFKTD